MSARRKSSSSQQSALLRSPRMLLALIVAVAILVAALMVVLSQLGGAGGSSASREDVGKLYSGIPQNGTTLGKGGAPLTIIGPDSVPAARAALAAGEQDRYWPYAQLLFENQGKENSGYVTDEFLKSQAQDTLGLDVGEWSSDLKRSSVTKQLQAAQARAQSAGVNATPTLIFSGPGGQTKLVGLYDYEQVSQAIAQVD